MKHVTWTMTEVVWKPPPDVRETSRIGRYLTWLEEHRGLTFHDYHALWRWSVDDLEGFWSSVVDYFGIDLGADPGRALAERAMPGARWFPEARLNYAAAALALPGREDDEEAIVSLSQSRPAGRLKVSELRDAVARARAGLARLGVGPGDRVAAYLPNIAETVVGMLATASLGATWSSCAPEFGTRSVVDRFGQIEPTVLLAIDGYRYGPKAVDRRSELAAIRSALPSLTATVVLPYLDPDAVSGIPGAIAWRDLVARPAAPTFEPVPFDHPLYVLYSSGTTGLPKAIVHGHGGILLEHL